MEPTKIKIVSLSKKIARQMEKHSEVSRIEYDIIMNNPTKVLGWVWSGDVE